MGSEFAFTTFHQVRRHLEFSRRSRSEIFVREETAGYRFYLLRRSWNGNLRYYHNWYGRLMIRQGSGATCLEFFLVSPTRSWKAAGVSGYSQRPRDTWTYIYNRRNYHYYVYHVWETSSWWWIKIRNALRAPNMHIYKIHIEGIFFFFFSRTYFHKAIFSPVAITSLSGAQTSRLTTG